MSKLGLNYPCFVSKTVKMIKREILSELEQWKKTAGRKPLVLRGARQVGKTTVIHEFGKSYPQYIYLNLEKKEELLLFERYDHLDELLQAIFFLKQKETKKQTLIFIDEIQESGAAIKMLRYFYEERPEIHVIAAGSLLENIFDHDVNFPVGRIEYRVLRPLSFREFLYGLDQGETEKVMKNIPLPSFAHDILLKLFHTYSIIGGMPEVVSSFIKHEEFTPLERIYEGLLVSYLDDVEKYAKSKSFSHVLRAIVQLVFAEAGNRIKFEGFGKTNYKSRDIGEALRTLEKAMLINLVYPTTQFKVPSLPDRKKSPRLQVLDTGLLNYYSGIQRGLPGVQDLNEAYQGTVAEHIVGQELLTLDFNALNTISFWVRDKTQSSAEVDFLFNYKGKLIPLEVKSGKKGTLRSLHLFMDNVDHQMAVRLYPGELRIDDVKTLNGKNFKLLSLPYFLVSKIPDYLKWFEGQI